MELADRESVGEEPLVPPGEGPFRIKGIGYLGHMRWIAEHFPGGGDAFMAELSPPMRVFFGQTFFAMSFFDLTPLVSAGHVCARVMRMSFFDFVVMRSRDQARSDLHGVYRAVLKLSSPRLVAARIPTLMNQYFDFSESAVVESDAHRVHFELRGIPVMFSDWFHAAYDGFSGVVITATGGVAANLEARVDRSSAFKGYPCCRMRMMCQWS